MRHNARGVVLWACMLTVLAALTQAYAAAAQEGYWGPEGEGESSACVPPCRAGHVCVEGLCRSPCNPNCVAGEVCSRRGNCVPATPPGSVALVTSPAYTAGAVGPIYPAQGMLVSDQAEYEKYRRKKDAGVALMLLGGLADLAAAGLFVGGSIDESESLLYAASGVGVLSVVLFFPGLGACIKGAVGMKRIIRQRNLQQGLVFASPGLTQISPFSPAAVSRLSAGLNLNFAF